MPDFIPESDAGLETFSRIFSQRLTQAGGDYNVSPQDAALYAQLQADFQARYRTANSPETSTRGATAAKKYARKRLELETRRLARVVRASNATEQQLIDLGLRPPRKPVHRLTVPRSFPHVSIVKTDGRRVFLRLTDSAKSELIGKPRGVIGAVIYTCVCAGAPGSDAKWEIRRLSSTPRIVLQFGPDLPPGTRIWFCARWLNPRLQAGPASNPVGTHLGGGATLPQELRLAA